jgi:hypothetical protein
LLFNAPLKLIFKLMANRFMYIVWQYEADVECIKSYETRGMLTREQ